VIKIFIFWYLGIICFKIPNISPEQIFDIPLQEREPVKMTVDPFSHTAANYNLLNYTMSFLVIMLCTCGGFHMCCYVTRLTWRVSLVEQELLTLPEHLSSPPVFSEVRDTRYLVLYVCFVDHCLSFCTFSFGHCVVCSSSIYGFWLPLWYLQTLLMEYYNWYYSISLRHG
jgi:hypothetical protein